MTTRVAVLGTGKMGSALAHRLAGAGFELTLWNRTRARAEDLGVGHVVDTPAEAVGAAEVVISSLTGPDAVRDTYTGTQGALSAASGQLFIEMSTAGPDIPAELAPHALRTGSTLIDAPVVGTPPVVLRGAAAILVGGSAEDVERARPLLQILGDVHHAGPLGSGARLKLVANSMLGAIATAAAELQTAGEATGLDAENVFWILARLVPSLEMRHAGYVESRHEPVMFALRDLRKDLHLASDLFIRHGSDVPLTELVGALVDEAARTAADLDISAVITRYRRRTAALAAGGPAAPLPR